MKWVWVHVVGNGKTDDNYYAVDGGDSFDRTIALRYGPGQYNFQILTSGSENKFGSYAVEHQGTFVNVFQDALDDIAPSCEVQSDAPEIIQLAEEITRGLETETKKTLAIHDWVAKNIAYDVDSYFSGTYFSKSWDALSVLRGGKAICQGYANLTAALNRAAGLRAKVLIGEVELFKDKAGKGVWGDHAWNKVYADGDWISQDTTWDAGFVNFTDHTFKFSLRHKYFDPAPADFAVDHREKN